MTGALYFINDHPDLPISSNVIKYVHLYPYSGHGNSGHTPTPLPAYKGGGYFKPQAKYLAVSFVYRNLGTLRVNSIE